MFYLLRGDDKDLYAGGIKYKGPFLFGKCWPFRQHSMDRLGLTECHKQFFSPFMIPVPGLW